MAPSAPSWTSLTWRSDSEIYFNWQDVSGASSYEVQMSRNGSSFEDPRSRTGPANPTDSNATYIASSTSGSTVGMVGVDSEYKFRVRSKDSSGTSSWNETGRLWTTPIPPQDVNVNRPDRSTVEISWTNESQVINSSPSTPHGIVIASRTDTGSGWSDWSGEGRIDFNQSGLSTSYTSSVSEDTRKQYRLRYWIEPQNDGTESYGNFVWSDYGTENGVLFDDDFSSGNAGAWGSADLSDSNSGINSGSSYSLQVDTSDYGGYYAVLAGGDHVATPVCDLTSVETPIVQGRVAVSSLDAGAGDTISVQVVHPDSGDWVEWTTIGPKYNKIGWFTFERRIPSWLHHSTFQVRFVPPSQSYDFVGVDRFRVTDGLPEYGSPAPPSSVSVDTSTKREVTVSVTHATSLDGSVTRGQRIRLFDDSTEVDTKWWVGDKTFTGLTDGIQYRAEAISRYYQYRHGSESNVWPSDVTSATGTTILEPVENVSTTHNADGTTTVTWDNTTNGSPSHSIIVDYGDGDTVDGTVSGSTTSYTTSQADPYSLSILTSTEDTEAETQTYTLTRVYDRTVTTTVDVEESASRSGYTAHRSAQTTVDAEQSIDWTTTKPRSATTTINTTSSSTRSLTFERDATTTVDVEESARVVVREVFNRGLRYHEITFDPERMAYVTEWFNEPPLREGNAFVLSLEPTIGPDAVHVKVDARVKDGSRLSSSPWTPVSDEKLPVVIPNLPMGDDIEYRVAFRNVRTSDDIYRMRTVVTSE